MVSSSFSVRAPFSRAVAIQVALAAVFFLGSHALGRWAWPQLLRAAGTERTLFSVGTFCVHMFLLVVLNGALAVLYAGRFAWVEAAKISSKPWPWRSPDPDERARFWQSTAWALATVLFNNVCVALPSAFSTYDLVAPRWGLLPASVAAFPALATVLWQVAVCAVVEDVMFYHTHRLLHWKPIYGWVHKWHHMWHHSIGIASECAHPLEFFVGNLVPVLAGPLLVRAHVFTFWVWLTVRIFETVDAHSGYDFAWSPARLTPWANSTASHDYHHAHNRGCFGSMFSVLDTLYGTDADFLAATGAGVGSDGSVSATAADAPAAARQARAHAKKAA